MTNLLAVILPWFARPRAATLTLQQNFSRELAANPRLHFGIIAIFVIILIGSWFAIDDRHRQTQDTLADRHRQLGELTRLVGEGEWRERRYAVLQLRAGLEARLWQGESDGLAQANFQDLATRLTTRNNIENVELKIEIVPATTTLKLRRMSVSLSGRFDPVKIQNLLADISRDPHILVVERLRIETAPVPRFDMLMTTYIRPVTPVATASPS